MEQTAPRHPLRQYFHASLEAWRQLNANDGWAMASHVALSGLLALFPFLIFLTAVASFFDNRALADTAVNLLFNALPRDIAEPLANEVHTVLLNQRGDLLTLGALLALWFASSGIEAMRVALNRAYDQIDQRWFYITRLRALMFVGLGTIALLSLAFLVVLGPSLWTLVLRFIPELASLTPGIDLLRYGISGLTLLLTLVLTHLWLPLGKRRFMDVLPGVILTLLAWMLAASIFAWYLGHFASYSKTYAGFASAMIALIFLYFLAILFIAGGEFNAALLKEQANTAPSQDLVENPVS